MVIELIGNMLAAVINPTQEQLERRDAWVEGHPLTMLVIVLVVLALYAWAGVE